MDSITVFFLVEFAVDVSQLQGHAEVHFVVDVESSDQRCSFISLGHWLLDGLMTVICSSKVVT